MRASEAESLIAAAVHERGGTWADLGAGSGTFTLALAALLGPRGRVYAIDRDRYALDELRASARRRAGGAAIEVAIGDFTDPGSLPEMELDGVLLANALHFVSDARQADVLATIAAHLRPHGRVVLVEYEGRGPSRWVPYPVSLARFRTLAAEAGLSPPTALATRRSMFGGEMYAALAQATR